MRFFGYLILIFVLIVLSFGFLGPVGAGWLIPGLPLLLIVCMTIEYGTLDYLFIGVVFGLWLDVLYGMPVGTFSGIYVIIGTVSYVLSQRLLWIDTGWKYYLSFILGADALLLVWIWGYTNVLLHFHWTTAALSGPELWHHAWKIVAVHAVFAFPVYGLVNYVVGRWHHFQRRPIHLS